MPRFPINSKQIQGNTAVISGDEFIHIYRVLRLGVNDQIELFDENENEYRCRINEIQKKEMQVEILEKFKNTKESLVEIYLFQSIPKGSKIDLIIQKTTELGVNSITPIKTKRGLVLESRKSERWSKIALEACKQCGRSKPPVINNFIDFKDIPDLLKKEDLNLLFYENQKSGLKEHLIGNRTDYKKINLIIGPEGGFTDQEIVYAEKNGITIVGLGPRILRVETASITAVSVIQYHFGDL